MTLSLQAFFPKGFVLQKMTHSRIDQHKLFAYILRILKHSPRLRRLRGYRTLSRKNRCVVGGLKHKRYAEGPIIVFLFLSINKASQ